MRSRVVALNSFLTGMDMLLTLVGSLVTIILVARVMGPVNLGYYTYVMWIVQVANVVGVFGAPAATRKYAAEYLANGDVATVLAIVRTTFRLQLLSSSILVSIGIAISCVVLTPDHRGYTVIALMSLLPAMLVGIPTAVNTAIEDFAPNVYSSIASQLTNIVGVALTLIAGWGLIGLSSSLFVSRCVDCGLRYYLYRSRFYAYLKERFGGIPVPAASIPLELRGRMVRFCWQATGLLMLNMIVWDRSEVFFLRHFCDIKEVAFYSMSFGVMKALANIPESFARAAGAALMTQHGYDPAALPLLASTTMRYQALIVIPVAFGMAAIGGPFIRLFYGERYAPAVPVLTIVALFSVSSAMVSAVNQLIVASDMQGFLLKWGILTGILNLGLDRWLIPSGGAKAAAIANGVSQLAGAVGIWAFAVRRFTIPLPWQTLFKLLFSALIMASFVTALGRHLSPAPATAVGAISGAGVFMLLLRFTRTLDRSDFKRLMTIQRMLPRRLQSWYEMGLEMVIV